MRLSLKLGAATLTGIATAVLALGATPGPEATLAPAPDPASLAAHALDLAIDGTTTHLLARRLATWPGRKKVEADAAVNQLQRQAHDAYDRARTLLDAARERSADPLSDLVSRQVFEASNAYIAVMWDLTRRATPYDQPSSKTRPSGALSLADVAALEAIDRAVAEAVDAFLIQQLAARMIPPTGPVARRLIETAEAMARSGASAAARFPTIPEAVRARYQGALDAADVHLGWLKEQETPLKDLEKDVKFHKNFGNQIKAEAGEAQLKAAREWLKAARDADSQFKKASQKGVDAAADARDAEISPDAGPEIAELARRGHALIQLLRNLTVLPEDEAKD